MEDAEALRRIKLGACGPETPLQVVQYGCKKRRDVYTHGGFMSMYGKTNAVL